MGIEDAIVVYSINYLIIIWSIFYKSLLSRKHCLALSIFLGVTVMLGISTHDRLLFLNILFFYLLQYFMMCFYLKTFLLPATFMILEYSLITFVWFFSYHIPVRYLTFIPFARDHQIILLSIIQSTALLLLAYWLKRFSLKHKIWRSLIDTQNKRYVGLGLIVYLLFLILMGLHVYISFKGNIFTLTLILSLIFVVTCLLISILILVNRTYQQQIYLEDMRLSLDEEQENFELAREYRHDLRSILISLTEYIKKKDLQGAEQFLDQMIEDANPYLKHYHYSQITHIQNTAIRGLFTEFIKECEGKGITLTLVLEDIGYVPPIPLIDFVRSLSILLNNAVEAVEEANDKQIQLTFKNTKKCLVFEIANPLMDQGLELAALCKKGQTTKADHSVIGLWNIRKMMRKYPNYLFTINQKEKYFIARLTLQR